MYTITRFLKNIKAQFPFFLFSINFAIGLKFLFLETILIIEKGVSYAPLSP